MDWFSIRKKHTLVSHETALAGREQEMQLVEPHRLFGCDLRRPLPAGEQRLFLGMGCFWGAERRLWQQLGVTLTAVGYGGGFTPNATYEEVCSGQTGHVELVLVDFDPEPTSLQALLKVFWEGHDPTQGMRQGNDLGTQYRSAIYTTSEEQLEIALASKAQYEAKLAAQGFGMITTEVAPASNFYFAEEYHQQYLDKNPNGYCGLRGTGVSCAI